MFACEYCEISKSISFEELRMVGSEVTLGSDCLGLSFWTIAFKIMLTYEHCKNTSRFQTRALNTIR